MPIIHDELTTTERAHWYLPNISGERWPELIEGRRLSLSKPTSPRFIEKIHTLVVRWGIWRNWRKLPKSRVVYRRRKNVTSFTVISGLTHVHPLFDGGFPVAAGGGWFYLAMVVLALHCWLIGCGVTLVYRLFGRPPIPATNGSVRKIRTYPEPHAAPGTNPPSP